VQGWTKEATVQELTEGGFGFHTIWFNLPRWIKNLDVDAVKKEIASQPSHKPLVRP
jgi:hypothetical protein